MRVLCIMVRREGKEGVYYFLILVEENEVCVCLEYIKKLMMVKIGIKFKLILFYKGMIVILY